MVKRVRSEVRRSISRSRQDFGHIIAGMGEDVEAILGKFDTPENWRSGLARADSMWEERQVVKRWR